MKRKWLCSLMIGCILTLGIWFVVHSTGNESEVISPIITTIDKQEKIKVTGMLEKIDDGLVHIRVDGEILPFYVRLEGVDPSTLSIKDEVTITYQFDPAKDIQSAMALVIVRKHMNSIQEKLDTMSLEEKVGQMFMARCPKDGSAIEKLQTYHFGGYMLFSEHVMQEDPASLRDKLTSYQNASSISLLISIDEEGGTVNRLSMFPAFRSVPFSSPQDLYKEGGMELILSDNEEKAAMLLSLGINVNLAPVADVSTDPDDFIYARSFGKNAEDTASYISQVVKNSKEIGIGTTLKHFPGYGNNVDTHTASSYDERPLNTFLTSDFLPFLAGIEAGADAILVNHNIVACMDDEYPASLSKNVHDILRKELGFHGVIMSDDLDMNAILQFSINKGLDPAILAIQSGNDILLTSQYKTQIPAVIEAVKNGEIDEASIDHSVYRILAWKQQLGLMDSL